MRRPGRLSVGWCVDREENLLLFQLCRLKLRDGYYPEWFRWGYYPFPHPARACIHTYLCIHTSVHTRLSDGQEIKGFPELVSDYGANREVVGWMGEEK